MGFHFLLQCMKVKSESEVAQSCPTLSDPWTAAYQAPLSMGFSRQEYWSGLPLPSPLEALSPAINWAAGIYQVSFSGLSSETGTVQGVGGSSGFPLLPWHQPSTAIVAPPDSWHRPHGIFSLFRSSFIEIQALDHVVV